jgi:hypothetical protein
MLKKSLSALISVVLVLTLCVTTCTSTFAATFSDKKYVKEMIISYGKTEAEAKKWLTDNDYEIIDNNLNDGADDTFSTKRAVYVGYKTTNDADEAVTDMKLMNMKGGYSVQDYQVLLEEQKTNIKQFFSDFKVAIEEYRTNYASKQERAVAAHDMLNLLYDDDTKQNLGDLLLNKVREEYTDEQYEALSDDEKAKVADMTTIIMQGNSDAVLAMEQLLAMASDDGETPWVTRYQEAKTYDDMVEELMDKESISVNDAAKKLATEYDQDAKIIAANFESYKDYIGKYTNSDITLTSSEEEIEAYAKANEDFDETEWFAAGTQYEVIKALENDDVSLYDLIFSDEYDVENADRYMLYPLVSVLSDGQRACLSYISMTQLVAIGINDDATVKAGVKSFDLASVESLQNTSIYAGVDRTIFGDDVAITGEAYKLQTSTGKSAIENYTAGVTGTTLLLWGVSIASLVCARLSWFGNSYMSELSETMNKTAVDLSTQMESIQKAAKESEEEFVDIAEKYVTGSNNEEYSVLEQRYENAIGRANSSEGFAKFFKIAGVAMTCVTIVLMIYSIWCSYQDIKAYYNAEFTPIPSNMVNQGVDENDEKVYTYYKAVKCNREAQGMVTDSNKLLEDYGDLNGDVGRQWVALYTTKDKAAGDPITTDFVVQTGNSNVPSDSTALSIFCESVAQNLTNKKAGYTYADSNDGIYLFYGTDANAFAGSAISNGMYALVGGVAAIVAAVAGYFVGKVTETKKRKNGKANV